MEINNKCDILLLSDCVYSVAVGVTYMKYINISKKLEELGLQAPTFNVCNRRIQDFTYMQVQLKGNLTFSKIKGAYMRKEEAEEHNQKCKEALEEAAATGVDLLLFPEYSISYELLEDICTSEQKQMNSRVWPNNNTVWCLPCQGIEYAEFDNFITSMKQIV